jgi:two-component system, OmpR family, copper resistance phosphate regulon response regulator CusR
MADEAQQACDAQSSDVHTPDSRILLAEDDEALADFLKTRLSREQYSVNLCHDGESAFQKITAESYELFICDLNLPKLDGFQVIQQLRPGKPNVPIIVLTGRTSVEDRVRALDCGADDCVSKPFSYVELAARVRALLRRGSRNAGHVLRVGDLLLDRLEIRVERAGKRIELTAKEFRVLEFLMLNARRPVTRHMIMESVWNSPYDPASNLVDVYMKYVRDKVDRGFENKLVRTIRGIGYRVGD